MSKPQGSVVPAHAKSPVSVFVTNLRFLDFDKRPDWPSISPSLFSVKDAPKNQKNRIHCVEWALYHLFEIWDPEETKNKLQAFFPPLAPIQSINLRAAIFRYLNELKKDGILRKDVTIRKTMLDECRGEKFEEVVAAFSTVVLHRVIAAEQHNKPNITSRLILAQNLPPEEQSSLIPLAIAHRVALTGILQEKARLRARYLGLQRRLDTKEQELRKRTEDLEITSDSREKPISPNVKIHEIKKHFDTHWQGDARWIDAIFNGGDQKKDPLLDTPFSTIWQKVSKGNAQPDVACQQGLLQQLEKRVATQEARLQKWKQLKEDLATTAKLTPKLGSVEDGTKPNQGLDLKFSSHTKLVLTPYDMQTNTADLPRMESLSAVKEQYERLTESMRRELALVDNVKERKANDFPIISKTLQATRPTENLEEPIKAIPITRQPTKLPKSIQNPIQATKRVEKVHSVPTNVSLVSLNEPILDSHQESQPLTQNRSYPLSIKSTQLIQPSEALEPEMDEEEILAQEIILSTMNAPSPIKPKLSLSERARKSMALASPEDLGRTAEPSPISKPSITQVTSVFASSSSNLNPIPRETLLERTRQSMSLLTPKPRKSMMDRRRASKIYPINQFGTPEKLSCTSNAEVLTPPEALFGRDVNYATVFKSRPKIALSPTLSPIDAGSHVQDEFMDVQPGEDWISDGCPGYGYKCWIKPGQPSPNDHADNGDASAGELNADAGVFNTQKDRTNAQEDATAPGAVDTVAAINPGLPADKGGAGSDETVAPTDLNQNTDPDAYGIDDTS